MSRLFGTDGVRGIANEKITPELAFQIGQAAGLWLQQSDEPKTVVIGRDTRKSGAMLGAALAAGFCSVGIDAHVLGIFPTGGVSWMVRKLKAGMGAVISASHNPAPDNGIKLIASSGGKVAEATEIWIEEHLGQEPGQRPTGADVGALIQDKTVGQAYADWLVTLVPEGLDGMKVAMDAAQGAAFEIAPDVFRRLGAEVILTGAEPDGMNINAEGGATKPETIQDLTKSSGAHIGVSFDGDADRAVFSDDKGNLINGDRMMGIWCAHWSKEGRLDPPAVVGTVMSNGGFESYMQKSGITLHRTNVGDKYVSIKLTELGGKIGGEQSGHIIIPEHGPTGDGLVTALELLRVMKREDRNASEFYGDFENWPQVLVNVEVESKDGWQDRPVIVDAMKAAELALAGHGRLNVRPSGTQPMIRVMVEADEYDLRDANVDRVVNALLSELGGRIYSRVDLTYALGD